MFKVTFFSNINEVVLGEKLKAMHFKHVKAGYEWYLDGNTFRIEPFKNQSKFHEYGYRAYFNGDISGSVYLFDMALSWVRPYINGVELQINHNNRTWDDVLKDLIHRTSFKVIDARGYFQKDNVNVLVLKDCMQLQIRGEKIKLNKCLKRIEMIRDEIIPQNFDLFSCLEEEIAV